VSVVTSITQQQIGLDQTAPTAFWNRTLTKPSHLKNRHIS